MNLESFRSSPSGRVVRVGSGDAAYWAFVPNKLPPELALDFELARTLSSADRALGELAGLGRTMPNPNLLIQPFIRREAVLSSRIEGTQAKLADLYAYEAGQPPLPGRKLTPIESDVREVHNYVRALEYGLERVNTLPVSLRLIRELHAHLMENVRGGQATPGDFRRGQNWIGQPGCTLDDATFVPPSIPDMLAALDEFEKYLHGECVYPPLVRLGLIHYQFEAIHPFLDGNGRIGRLIISLLLVNWTLLPLPLLYLSAYFERNRNSYYDLLLEVSRSGAWRDWLVFFLRGIDEQARDAITRAKQLQDLQLDCKMRLTQARASALLLRLADKLFETPAVTTPQVQKMLGVTHRSASQAIAKLVQDGILRPVPGRARNRQFVAQAILDILGEENGPLE